MKKHAFLNDLYNGKKIQVVNPSEDMKVSYLRKSGSYLQSAKLLRDNEHFEEAVSLAYFLHEACEQTVSLTVTMGAGAIHSPGRIISKCDK